MEYSKIFDPSNPCSFEKILPNLKIMGDYSSKSRYVFHKKSILAINVAIATGRPLLVRGPSGWGKSSLARSVADILGWRYYEKVISSRMQARDLLWEVDTIRRLQDAQARALKNDIIHYIKPGVLWKAFNLKSASEQEAIALDLSYKSSYTYKKQCYFKNNPPAVVLLDEIDKADPDLPNNLLVPLGSLYFTIEETGTKIECENGKIPLIFITTNDERGLPPAFLRRCVELELPKLSLESIGNAHFDEKYKDLIKKVSDLLEPIEIKPSNEDLLDVAVSKPSKEDLLINPSSPSPAEFIDIINACIKLDIDVDSESDIWKMLEIITIWKHGRRKEDNFAEK